MDTEPGALPSRLGARADDASAGTPDAGRRSTSPPRGSRASHGAAPPEGGRRFEGNPPPRDAGNPASPGKSSASKYRGGLRGDELSRLAERLEEAPASEIIAWAIQRFGGSLAVACSFQVEDVAIIDMVARAGGLNRVTVFYLDTGLHFPETYATCRRVAEFYGIEPVAVKPELTLAQQASRYGPRLWARDPDLCCRLRKVEPLRRFLRHFDAWITGIRREQTPQRARAPVVEADTRFGLVKINPLVRWTHGQVWDYVLRHGVPYNSLHDQGYPSIGCQPCTRPVVAGEDPRAGRWSGFAKSECGLHA